MDGETLCDLVARSKNQYWRLINGIIAVSE